MTSPELLAALAKIAFPLDGSPKEAKQWAGELGAVVGCLKIGLELFINAGPAIVEEIRLVAPNVKIFLDLKLHDIPNTMAMATKAAARLGVDFLTVHAQAGAAGLKAAVAEAGPVKILAVTALTSLRPEDLPELAKAYKAPNRFVLLLAQRALEAGCAGLVASPAEVAAIRAKFGPKPFVATPGVRPAWAQVASDDQQRVGSPAAAIADGADLLVVGRPIRLSPDRPKAALAVAQEILG